MKERKQRSKYSKIYKLGKERLQKLFDEYPTYTDIIKAIGYVSLSDNLRTLKDVADHFSIDLTKFNINHEQHIKDLNYNILRVDHLKDLTYSELISITKSRGTIKRYIISKDLIPYKCSECGNDGNYNGKALVLQLDHIDGNPINNKLENLRFLCPNCHTQTDTYAGRKINKSENTCDVCGKVLKYYTKHGMCQECYFESDIFLDMIRQTDRIRRRKFEISKEELEKLIEEYPFTKIGEMFGVSDNAIKKRCVALGIDLSNRKFCKTYPHINRKL